MMVERIHPKAPVMLIFNAIFTCLTSCINLSNIHPMSHMSFIRDSVTYSDQMSTVILCRNLINIQSLLTFSRRIKYLQLFGINKQ